MKTICILWALLVCARPALAEAPQQWELLKLPNGTEYSKAVLLAVEDDGIKISHANGVARIPHEKLPAELQERFPVDVEKVKAARAKRADEQRVANAWRRQGAKVEMGHVDYGKIKFEIVNVKVVKIEPEGIICYRYQPSGAAGETARTVNALVDKPDRLRGPRQDTTVEASPPGPLWILQGCKEKAAEGDVLVGIAGRYGEKEWQGRTLQRWIAKPD
jgi:hypothetical protein